MLGVDNYIVKSDDIGKLTKAVKDVNFNDSEDKLNEKSEEVRQRARNDIFDFGGREKFSWEACSGLEGGSFFKQQQFDFKLAGCFIFRPVLSFVAFIRPHSRRLEVVHANITR